MSVLVSCPSLYVCLVYNLNKYVSSCKPLVAGGPISGTEQQATHPV